MVCPCLAVPLLVGGAVGSASEVDMTLLSIAVSIVVVLYLILRTEEQKPCSECVYRPSS